MWWVWRSLIEDIRTKTKWSVLQDKHREFPANNVPIIFLRNSRLIMVGSLPRQKLWIFKNIFLNIFWSFFYKFLFKVLPMKKLFIPDKLFKKNFSNCKNLDNNYRQKFNFFCYSLMDIFSFISQEFPNEWIELNFKKYYFKIFPDQNREFLRF